MARTTVFFTFVTAVFCQQQIQLNNIREWRQIDFDFPNPTVRADAINRGLFNQSNVTPVDVDVDYQIPLERSRIFVTTPRFTPGVPVSLGYVSPQANDLTIQPYPDYSWHASHGANCDGITSVVRIAIDPCRQLWVLDSGSINRTIVCPPQLLVFNLANDNLVRRYKFPQSQYVATSIFITPVLDVKNLFAFGNCADTKVYIADVTEPALLVYDAVTNKSWRIRNQLFNPTPNYSRFTIAGESFDLPDGIFGLAISRGILPFITDDNRYLFFHSLAGVNENAVSLSTINNAAVWQVNPNVQSAAFRSIGERGIQTSAQAMDSNGNMFFVLLDPLVLVCWDSSTPYSRDNIRVILQNDQTLQFASGLKIIKNFSGVEELWILTNRFQKVSAGTLNFNEINFRIQTRSINELLIGFPKCFGPSLNQYNPLNFLFTNFQNI